MWHDYQGDWNKSHKLIDRESDKDCAWVHAYLHRVEGDLWNARYWYRRSGKPESKLSLNEERQQIAEALLRAVSLTFAFEISNFITIELFEAFSHYRD